MGGLADGERWLDFHNGIDIIPEIWVPPLRKLERKNDKVQLHIPGVTRKPLQARAAVFFQKTDSGSRTSAVSVLDFIDLGAAVPVEVAGAYGCCGRCEKETIERNGFGIQLSQFQERAGIMNTNRNSSGIHISHAQISFFPNSFQCSIHCR